MRVTKVPLPPSDLLQLFLSLLEDTGVQENHHHQRQVEGHDRGGHGIRCVGVEIATVLIGQALASFRIARHPPLQVDGQEGDEGGHRPNPEDHCEGPTPGQQKETRG